MDHINLFQTNAEFLSAYNGSDYIEPWLSYTMETSGVSYNKPSVPPQPIDYKSTPLTIEIIEGNGNLSLIQCTRDDSTLYYRINDGEWIEATGWQESGWNMVLPINVRENDKIQFKGSFWVGDGSDIKWEFLSNNDATSSLRYCVYGNIMSLIDATNYANMTSFPTGYTIVFADKFNYCLGLISAENLILPVTSLPDFCYASMFQGCTGLTLAPELPATTLVYSCYQAMFRDCTNLNYIKCLATDISADYCTENWVNGVSSSGTFVKAPSMTSWTTGDNGIPANWTVQDAS